MLTDVVFLDRGRIVLACSMEELESRFVEVVVKPEQAAAARQFKPIHERQGLGRSVFLFDRADRQQLGAFGELHTPTVADLFIAVMGNHAGEAQGVLK